MRRLAAGATAGMTDAAVDRFSPNSGRSQRDAPHDLVGHDAGDRRAADDDRASAPAERPLPCSACAIMMIAVWCTM